MVSPPSACPFSGPLTRSPLKNSRFPGCHQSLYWIPTDTTLPEVETHESTLFYGCPWVSSSPPLPWWWFLSCHQPMRIIPFLNSRSSPLPLRIREQPMRVSIGLVTHTQCRGGGGQVLLVDGGRRMESNESHLSRINEVILIGNSTSVLLPTQSPFPSSHVVIQCLSSSSFSLSPRIQIEELFMSGPSSPVSLGSVDSSSESSSLKSPEDPLPATWTEGGGGGGV